MGTHWWRGARRPKQINVNFALPMVGGISGTWEPRRAESEAAWELNVELSTRIATVPLPSEEGLLREALTSLHSIFASTREILRRHGPEVAPPTSPSGITLGSVAVMVLASLRPLLTKWHPELEAWESKKGDHVSRLEHERAWAHAAQLRAEIENRRVMLVDLTKILAEVAGTAQLLPEPPSLDDPENTPGGGNVNVAVGHGVRGFQVVASEESVRKVVSCRRSSSGCSSGMKWPQSAIAAERRSAA